MTSFRDNYSKGKQRYRACELRLNYQMYCSCSETFVRSSIKRKQLTTHRNFLSQSFLHRYHSLDRPGKAQVNAFLSGKQRRTGVSGSVEGTNILTVKYANSGTYKFVPEAWMST